MLLTRVLAAGLPLVAYVILGAAVDRWVFRGTVGSTAARQTLELLALRVIFPVAVCLGVSSVDLASIDWGFVGSLTLLHAAMPIPGVVLWGCGLTDREGFVSAAATAFLPSALIIGPPVLLGLWGHSVLSYVIFFIFVQSTLSMPFVLGLYEAASAAQKRDAARAEAEIAGEGAVSDAAVAAAAAHPALPPAQVEPTPIQLPVGASVELPTPRAEQRRASQACDFGTQTMEPVPLENTQPALAQRTTLVQVPARVAAGRIILAVLRAPVMIGLMTGTFLAAVPILRPPESVTKHAEPLTGAGSALALMCVGSFAVSGDRRRSSGADISGGRAREWYELGFLLLVRHILIPLVGLGIALVMPGEAIGKKVLVVAAGLPLSAASFVFASRYQVSPGSIAGVVAVGTIFGLVPSMLLWVKVTEMVFGDDVSPTPSPT